MLRNGNRHEQEKALDTWRLENPDLIKTPEERLAAARADLSEGAFNGMINFVMDKLKLKVRNGRY